MPLFFRISATDWLEEVSEISESWTVEDTVKLAPILADKGVDVLDVSSGGNHPKQHPHAGPAYQAPFAIKVKKAVGDKMAVSVVGMIDNAHLANDLLEKDGLDIITVGRGFQKNPGLVFAWADELNIHVQMPNQVSDCLYFRPECMLGVLLTCQYRFAGASVVVEARPLPSLSSTVRNS
jgi:2,4-dienoyl-CoA reductase-like NADH-dependent reductase (Old Yellow Enzyme family)